MNFKFTLLSFHDKHIDMNWYLEIIAKSCLQFYVWDYFQGLIFLWKFKKCLSDYDRPTSVKNFILSTMNFVMEGQYS